jgi:multisubunit Na+/H+ antiporter MnhB subunit
MIVQSFLAKSIVIILIGVILFLVFMAYFAPDMMVALTNQVWAMCGW